MRPLVSSHELSGLPSERGRPDSRSVAAREIQRLAEKATHYGPNGFSVRGDRGRRAERQSQNAASSGIPLKDLSWEQQPGAFIKDQPLHVRRILRSLTSEDVENVELDVMMTVEYVSEPGMRYKFGPEVPEVLETKPTIWKVPGHDPDRR